MVHFILYVGRAFSLMGIVSTIYWLYSLRTKWLDHKSRAQEMARRLRLLRNTDHFIAHLIHFGGEGSDIKVLTVFGEEEGGYFFNPPQDFVRVGSNRPRDVSLICASDLSRSEGYVIDSIAGPDGKFQRTRSPDMCHLLHRSMRDEIRVKFVRRDPPRLRSRQSKKPLWSRWLPLVFRADPST